MALRFQDGGTVREGAYYVARAADEELVHKLAAGEYCYVLAPRQIGKSSLLVRTARTLRAQGIRCAELDLSKIGKEASEEQWYFGLIQELADELGLEDPLEFWEHNPQLTPAHKWVRFLYEVVGADNPPPTVIFIDEIDTMLALPFSRDTFLGSIRNIFNEGFKKPELRQITFCLMGVATPGELVRDERVTPFNIGANVRLSDFNRQEAEALLPGLEQVSDDPRSVLAEVMDWTDGHPYMTHRLCAALVQTNGAVTPDTVDHLVQEKFLERGLLEDSSLVYADNQFKGSADTQRAALLQRYRRLLEGEAVPADGDDATQMKLRLTGLAAERADARGVWLRVRNRIFAQVFNKAWVAQKEAGRRFADQVALWLESGREVDYLLRGQALNQAGEWLRTSKDVTALEREFVVAGQDAERARQEAERKDQELQQEQKLEFERQISKAAQEAARLERRNSRLRGQLAALLALALLIVTGATFEAIRLAFAEKNAKNNETKSKNEALAEKDTAQKATHQAQVAESNAKIAAQMAKLEKNRAIEEEKKATAAKKQADKAAQNLSLANIDLKKAKQRLKEKTESLNELLYRTRNNRDRLVALNETNYLQSAELTAKAKQLNAALKTVTAEKNATKEALAKATTAQQQVLAALDGQKKATDEAKSALNREQDALKKAQDAAEREKQTNATLTRAIARLQAEWKEKGKNATDLAWRPGKEIDALVEGIKAVGGPLKVGLDAPDEALVGLANAVAAMHRSVPIATVANPKYILLSPDGTRLAACFSDPNHLATTPGGATTTLRVWDTATGAALYSHNNIDVKSMAFAPSGQRLVVSGAYNRNNVAAVQAGAAPSYDPTAVNASPSAANTRGQKTQNGISEKANSVSGVFLVNVGDARHPAASQDTFTPLLENGHPLLPGAGKKVVWVSAGQGERIVLAGEDYCLRIYDTGETPALVGRYRYPCRNSPASVALSADGERLLAFDMDGNVCVWDTAQGERAKPHYSFRQKSLTDAVLGADGASVFTMSKDVGLCQWALDKPKPNEPIIFGPGFAAMQAAGHGKLTTQNSGSSGHLLGEIRYAPDGVTLMVVGPGKCALIDTGSKQYTFLDIHIPDGASVVAMAYDLQKLRAAVVEADTTLPLSPTKIQVIDSSASSEKIGSIDVAGNNKDYSQKLLQDAWEWIKYRDKMEQARVEDYADLPFLKDSTNGSH